MAAVRHLGFTMRAFGLGLPIFGGHNWCVKLVSAVYTSKDMRVLVLREFGLK